MFVLMWFCLHNVCWHRRGYMRITTPIETKVEMFDENNELKLTLWHCMLDVHDCLIVCSINCF